MRCWYGGGLCVSHAPVIFGPKDTALTPVAGLMLLVFSAARMGILVFGQRGMRYIEGMKSIGPAGGHNGGAAGVAGANGCRIARNALNLIGELTNERGGRDG